MRRPTRVPVTLDEKKTKLLRDSDNGDIRQTVGKGGGKYYMLGGLRG